jgi:hypothetical protein
MSLVNNDEEGALLNFAVRTTLIKQCLDEHLVLRQTWLQHNRWLTKFEQFMPVVIRRCNRNGVSDSVCYSLYVVLTGCWQLIIRWSLENLTKVPLFNVPWLALNLCSSVFTFQLFGITRGFLVLLLLLTKDLPPGLWNVRSSRFRGRTTKEGMHTFRVSLDVPQNKLENARHSASSRKHLMEEKIELGCENWSSRNGVAKASSHQGCHTVSTGKLLPAFRVKQPKKSSVCIRQSGRIYKPSRRLNSIKYSPVSSRMSWANGE